LVLDVQLPDINGFELQQQLAKKGLQVPIIFLTGYGDIPQSVRAMKAGAIEFLTKPFRGEELLNAINQAIERGAEDSFKKSDCRFTSHCPASRICHTFRIRCNSETLSNRLRVTSQHSAI
jgi:FixJ family two-component response regulator